MERADSPPQCQVSPVSWRWRCLRWEWLRARAHEGAGECGFHAGAQRGRLLRLHVLAPPLWLPTETEKREKIPPPKKKKSSTKNKTKTKNKCYLKDIIITKPDLYRRVKTAIVDIKQAVQTLTIYMLMEN